MTQSPGKAKARTKRASARLREVALGYPETREDHPWGHSAFKVKSKTFVFMSADDTGLSLSLKLGPSHSPALSLPFTEPTHYGLGKSGWVTASFGPNDDPPVPILEQWIDESYRLIAPKSAVKQLDGAAAPASRTRKPKALKRAQQTKTRRAAF